jgi:hypothetical protein
MGWHNGALQRGASTGRRKAKNKQKKTNLSPYQALIIQTFYLLSTGMFQKQKQKSKTQSKPKSEKEEKKTIKNQNISKKIF